ncbi:AAA family ATPase [Streptomyces sp. NPDC046977]|uniref:AAA family ATPase n=1 Tax=Streptomyces sp. NPDC046977 TaxID=3154703 RepID=UPI0033DECB5E
MLYVITGPPAGGKSTWIEAHAKPTDVVIDLDRITAAISGPGAPGWNQNPLQLRVAHKARYAAMYEAFELREQLDVYLIHTMPQAKAMARYKRLGARIVVVDPGRDIVMQRIEAMRDPGMQRVAARWYRSRPARSAGAVSQPSRAW